MCSVASTKDTSIAINLGIYSDSPQWNRSFIRVARDLEVDAISGSFNMLYSLD